MKKVRVINQTKIYCNKCGCELNLVPKKSRGADSGVEISVEWGYFSDKDGEIHKIILCEDCYDEWVSGFARPVKIEEKKELLN